MSYSTLWEVPEGLWAKIERILPPDKPAGSRGRPALPNRQVLNGILFVLRSGCQWKGLKKEWFGANSSLHARFQDWNEAGVWKKVYRVIGLVFSLLGLYSNLEYRISTGLVQD